MPRILLIEDNEMNRDRLSCRVQRRGYEIGIATDGIAGVQCALEGGWDAILMDMSLRKIDGWEATRRLRTASSGSRVPIIALTAHAMSGDRDKALEAGCDDYDTKPVDLDRLLRKLEALLQRPAGPAGPAA